MCTHTHTDLQIVLLKTEDYFISTLGIKRKFKLDLVLFSVLSTFYLRIILGQGVMTGQV